jgi:Swiss Army Knife protein, DSP-PTPase phosphatase domain
MDELMGKTCSYFYPRSLGGFTGNIKVVCAATGGENAKGPGNDNYCKQQDDHELKKALFGGYPTQKQVFLLEDLGVKWFIDLTLGNEKRTTPYTVSDKNKYIAYPIIDQHVPSDIIGFVKFINKLISIISGLVGNEKMYIHCKGGHGRSGLIAATLLCAMDELTPEKAIEETTMSHNQRYMMKRKWKRIGSPQTRDQCNFLYSLFESQNIDNDFLLSPLSPHKITITFNNHNNHNSASLLPHLLNTKIFDTVNDAIHYMMNSVTDAGGRAQYTKYRQCVEFVLNMKFQQHHACKKQLLETGFRQLRCSVGNPNCVGTICIKLRNEYYSPGELQNTLR